MALPNNPTEHWDLVIKPDSKLLDLKIRELIRYRDLVWLFIQRDFVVQYKQTVLGPLWYIITPLISTVMYTFIFGNLAKIGTDGIPYILFYYSGTMLWTYFAGCITNAADTFKTNANIFSKVYFPRLTVPIANIFSNLIKALIQFTTLMLFYGYYLIKGAPITPSWMIIFFPFLFAWIAAFATGLGMLISALTTKYKDLNFVLTFAISLAIYATPVVYPLSQSPKNFLWFFYVNPLSAPIELFRIWFYGAGNVPPNMILISLAITIFTFIFGLIIFNRNERTFVDVI